MLHITYSKYDCIIVHKAYYLFTCTCVSINSFHSHSHICTGASSNTILDYNLVRFGVCIIKLCHERMLILTCILPPQKTELSPEKKFPPPPAITTPSQK